MKKNITILPGDGVGPEVIEQAVTVLDSVSSVFGHTFNYSYGAVGAIAIDKFNDPLPGSTLDLCKNGDAVLFGAIGDPKYDDDPSATVRPEQGLLKLRKELGLFANVRPVKIYKGLEALSPLKEERLKGTNIVVYRELTSGIYFGEKGKTDNGDSAFDVCSYTKDEIKRIAVKAFEAATCRRNVLTLVDKANVLETSRLWREVVRELASQYPGVAVNYMFVDNAAMQVIINPSQFDVILTENMFGDIITDQLSAVTGSIGLMASASEGTGVSLYEPIHGSYPQAKGKDIANPCAAILSAAMMLRGFGLEQEAKLIESSIEAAIKQGVVTQDLDPTHFVSCSRMGAIIAMMVEEHGTEEPKISEYVFEGSIPII